MSDLDDGGENALELNGWSPRHLKVAMLLGAGRPTKEVAAEAGIGRETVWRYQQLPGFVELVDRFSAIFFKGLVNGMWALTEHSMEVLHGALDERDTDAALDIFKTTARGLRDRSTPDPAEMSSSPSAAADGGSGEEERVEVDVKPADHQCPHCSTKTKSARGLTQHIKRKH